MVLLSFIIIDLSVDLIKSQRYDHCICSFWLIVSTGLHQISHICFLSLTWTPPWKAQFCSLSSTTGLIVICWHCMVMYISQPWSSNFFIFFAICSCLKVILEMLEKLPNPDINFLLFECGFQVRHADPGWWLSGLFKEASSIWSIVFLTIFHTLQLLCELSLDPLTSGPIMDLLSSKKYQFFLRVR